MKKSAKQGVYVVIVLAVVIVGIVWDSETNACSLSFEYILNETLK